VHGVGPKFGANFNTLIGIFSRTAEPACGFWASPVSFRFAARQDAGESADQSTISRCDGYSELLNFSSLLLALVEIASRVIPELLVF
jgi:hypothetical protein